MESANKDFPQEGKMRRKGDIIRVGILGVASLGVGVAMEEG